MTSALLGMAARAAAPMAAQYVGTMFSGRQGETIGSRNSADAEDFREKARKLNVDPDTYARIAGSLNDEARGKQQNMSRADQAFTNQMQMGNQRAFSQMKMAENDQNIAANQAMDLAQGYRNAAADQANASIGMANAVANSMRKAF